MSREPKVGSLLSGDGISPNNLTNSHVRVDLGDAGLTAAEQLDALAVAFLH